MVLHTKKLFQQHADHPECKRDDQIDRIPDFQKFEIHNKEEEKLENLK